jgi:hypothetical protein
MKKVISILAILLCFATSYGQDTKPTKQETMDWIAKKFQSAIKTAKQFVMNTPRTDIAFIYSYSFSYYKDGKIGIIEDWNLNSKYNNGEKGDITIYEIDLNKLNRIEYDGMSLFGTNLIKITKKSISSNENKINLSVTYQGGDNISMIDYEAEPNLKERMKKALEALVKYNTINDKPEKF